ncbi:hypothetical protein [Ekhidna sp.]|uniref:hypothetical protein n=1 Tax=Ekhidna sp. TaxID=2608089 RepID=UPI003B5B6135
MKELSLEKMENVEGGGCTVGEGAAVVASAVGVGLAIAFPPAGFALIFATGLSAGFSLGASLAECTS